MQFIALATILVSIAVAQGIVIDTPYVASPTSVSIGTHSDSLKTLGPPLFNAPTLRSIGRAVLVSLTPIHSDFPRVDISS